MRFKAEKSMLKKYYIIKRLHYFKWLEDNGVMFLKLNIIFQFPKNYIGYFLLVFLISTLYSLFH